MVDGGERRLYVGEQSTYYFPASPLSFDPGREVDHGLLTGSTGSSPIVSLVKEVVSFELVR